MIHICKLHDLKFPCIYVYALCLLKYRKVLIIWTMMVDSLKKNKICLAVSLYFKWTTNKQKIMLILGWEEIG